MWGKKNDVTQSCIKGKVDDGWAVLRARVSFGEEPQKRAKVLRQVGGKRKTRRNKDTDVVKWRSVKRTKMPQGIEVSLFAYASNAISESLKPEPKPPALRVTK